MSLTEGSTFAGMQIAAPLGSDSHSDYYLVDHPHLGRQILKVAPLPSTDTESFAAGLRREVAVASTVFDHPAIIGITDSGFDAHNFWCTLTPFDAVDLSTARLSGPDTARIATDIAGALDYAHSRNILHRDIRPSAIVAHIDPTTGAIGSAGLLSLGLGSLSAQPGEPLDVAYPAPEVAAGATLSPRSDQFALAATLYELLTGATPEPGNLTKVRPDLARLEPILSRALHPNPAERFPNCTSFAKEISRAVARTRGGRQPSGSASARGRRTPLLIGLALAVVALLVGGGIAAIALTGGDASPADEAAPPTAQQPTETIPSGPEVTDIAMYRGAVCAVADGEMYCWGNIASSADTSVPRKAPGVTGITSVGVNQEAYCAVSAGDLHCGGPADWLPESATDLTKIEGVSGITDISMIGRNICVVADGDAYCWGSRNSSGELGVAPETEELLAPTKVEGLGTVTAIRTVVDSTCAISDGDVFCWGKERTVEILARGEGNFSPIPTRVEGLEGLEPTGLTDSHEPCALSSRGMQCWVNRGPPIARLPELTAVTDDCAISEGKVLCWGDNTSGQRGDGGSEGTTGPVELPELTDAVALAHSDYTNCAVAGGRAYCWGDNSASQIGDGTTTQRDTPTLVTF